MSHDTTLRQSTSIIEFLQRENDDLEQHLIAQTQIQNNAFIRYKQLFNESSIGLLLVEIDEFPFLASQMHIIDTNRAMNILTHLNWTSIIGCTLDQFKNYDRWLALLMRCFTDTEHPILLTDADIYVKVGVSRLSRSLCCFTFQDVTSEIFRSVQLEAELSNAKESDALKLAFLSNMSHEIRTPLNGIVGFVDLLLCQQHLSEEKKTSFLEMIRFSSEQLVRVVNDILDITKIESNKLELMPTRCNINTLIDNMQMFAEVEQQRLRRYDITITNRKSLKDNHAHILADGIRLRQVLFNLLTNAIKFSFVGFVKFGYKYEAESNELLFFVEDSGIGIRAEEQATVFDRFKQLRHNLELSQSGTGLGLAICKHLVNLMGGRIWLESEEDRGSVFRFTIPYNEAIDVHNTTTK